KEAEKDAQQKPTEGDKKMTVIEHLRKKLQTVKRWNRKTTDSVCKLVESWLPNSRFDLGKILKAIVVGRTMLLVSAVSNEATASQMSKIRVDVPDAFSYIHEVLIHASQS